MKLKIVFAVMMVSLIAGCAGVAVAPEFNGIQSFKGVKWGMSKDKVQVVIDRDLKKLDAMKYYMGDEMYGMPCKVTFEFGLKDSLRSVIIDYDTMNPEAEYDYVAKNITQAYGAPKKSGKDSGIIWHTADTVAVLMMIGGMEKQIKLTFVQKEK